jgi:hypothetical protein
VDLVPHLCQPLPYLFVIGFDPAVAGISTRVELVLYAVNNGDPRHAEWLSGSARNADGLR